MSIYQEAPNKRPNRRRLLSSKGETLSIVYSIKMKAAFVASGMEEGIIQNS